MIDDYPRAHKKLLSEIDWEIECCDWRAPSRQKLRWVAIMEALRVVIELHKPFQFADGIDEYKFVCEHCQLGAVGDTYPCETIRSIAEELE